MARIIEVTFEAVQPDAAREYYRVRCRSGITGEDAKRHVLYEGNSLPNASTVLLAAVRNAAKGELDPTVALQV